MPPTPEHSWERPDKATGRTDRFVRTGDHHVVAGTPVESVIDSEGRRRYLIPGVVDIWLVGGTTAAAVKRLCEQAGVRADVVDLESGYVRARTATGVGGLDSTFEAIARVNADPAVAFVEPAETGPPRLEWYSLEPATEFEDAGADRGWNHRMIGLADAHATTLGSGDTVVFVIDSGCRVEHPDLAPALLAGWQELDLNFDLSVDPRVTSPDERSRGHGTGVAGVAVGRATSIAAGSRGVAPAATLVPIKIDGSPIDGSYALRALAIRRAVALLGPGQRGIVNISWSTTGEHLGIREAIVAATAAGLAVVCSAGNAPPGAIPVADERHLPSGYAPAGSAPIGDVGGHRRIPGVCSVAAVDSHGRRASYSYFGESSVTFAAPGGEPGGAGHGVLVASCPVTYAYAAGTSFAAPHVAGLLALVWSAAPSLSAVEAIDHVRRTCRPAAPELGAGICDAAAAVRSAAGHAPPVDTRGQARAVADSRLDLNVASAAELARLPLLGAWTAARVVADRDRRGPFRSIDDLGRTGVVDAWTIERLRAVVRV